MRLVKHSNLMKESTVRLIAIAAPILLCSGQLCAQSPAPSNPTAPDVEVVTAHAQRWIASQSGGRKWSMSPDGRSLIYQEMRGRYGAPDESLWIARAPHWRARELMPHAAGQTFAGQVLWSPNGRRVALARLRGSEVQLVVIDPERSSAVMWQSACLLPRFVERYGGPASAFHFAWTDDDHLIALRAVGVCRAADAEFVGDMSEAISAWRTYSREREPADWVVESGVPVTAASFPQAEVVRFDIRTGAESIVARGPIEEFSVSPDDAWVALRERTTVTPVTAETVLVVGSRSRYAVRVASIAHPGSGWVLPTRRNVVPNTLQWSPRGRELAWVEAEWISESSDQSCAVSFDVESRRETGRVCGTLGGHPWRVSRPCEDNPIEWSGGEIRSTVTWSANEHLLVRRADQNDPSRVENTRSDWVEATAQGLVNLTSELAAVPGAIYTAGAKTLALVDGHILSLDVPADVPLSFRAVPSTARLASIETVRQAADGTVLVVGRSAKDSGPASLLYVNLSTGNVERIAMLPEENMEAFALDRPVALVTRWEEAKRIERLEVVESHQRTPVGVVPFAKASPVPQAPTVEVREVPFNAPNGSALVAELTLPPHAEPRRRYPTIVWGYPLSDNVAEARHLAHQSPEQVPLTDEGPTDFQHYSEYGFAVLHVPVYYRETDAQDGVLLERFAAGYDAAIDAAAALGMIDTNRLGLIGHSFGGYAVMGVLTRSKRFRAGVALAGPADLFLNHDLQWTSSSRYARSDIAGPLVPQEAVEAGQFCLNGSPWQRQQAYLADSPYFAADRITAPLLIIQGDQDFVSPAQGEVMFGALTRLGKRATFVRYAGEGHIIGQAFNAADAEQRIRKWFEVYLR